jgi:single-stranded DNA-specific DHH superfamily exonuclease
MLSKQDLNKIKDSLENSQNPLFFFDNDVDGLCSFIILQRAIGRGRGVAIKSFPDLDKSYLKKIEELSPDHIFILDKPLVSQEFIEGVKEKNLPLTWIDHHKIENKVDSEIEYFNSSPTSEPTTYLAQKVFNRQEDIWLAITGCIGDNFMPEFAEKYYLENPELLGTIKSPFDCMYKTEIGKITEMLNFGLKDTTTNVIQMIRLLLKAKSPLDILEENVNTKNLHYRHDKLKKQMEIILQKSKKIKNLILLEYSGETSMSSELSNKLKYDNPDKYILVIYKKQDCGNISIRGIKAKEVLLKSITNIENATGGGHQEACGARVPIDRLDEFKNNFTKIVNQ